MTNQLASDELAIQTNVQRLLETKGRYLREIEAIDKQLTLENVKYASIRNGKNPIFQVPNEIMSMIFTMVHNSYRWSTSAKTRHYALPFLISWSHICLRWREVILNTPLLWHEIVMSFRRGFATKGSLDRLEAHLLRSGDCYVDMVLNLTGDYVGYPAFLELIGRHSRRWRRVSFLVDFADIGDFQAAFRHLETPSLEHFSITIQNTPGLGPKSPRVAYTMDPTPIFSQGTPKLTFLRLGGGALGILRPNCTEMHTLHLDSWSRSFVTWAQLKDLLESLSRLENLSTNKLCIRYPRDPLETPAHMHLRHLRCLRVREPFTPINMVLPLIVMPKLEEMFLQRVDGFDSEVIASLTHISLEACAFEGLQLATLIVQFPNVNSLTVDDCSFSDLCEWLRPGQEGLINEHLPWPKLTTLTVRQLTGRDTIHLRLLIISRADNQRSIRTLRLDRRTRTLLRMKNSLDWFAEQLHLENQDFEETWPPGLGYEDPHDLE